MTFKSTVYRKQRKIKLPAVCSFQQFQEWLRSIKDVPSPSAYAEWIKGILVSTSSREEFRKWPRTSRIHDTFDADKPDGEHVKSIFPERVQLQKEVAHDRTENQYPIYDTLVNMIKF